MKLSVRNIEGEKVQEITVEDAVFGLKPNLAVLHQALVAQRANQRRGTASTKTRGQVQGSTRKTRPQKYTGRARQGSLRAPHRRGGGVVFGPKPRDYSQRLPKRMNRLAIRSALSGKLADGQLVVVDQFTFPTPKTKEMLRILRNLGIQRSVLVVTEEADAGVRVSARNLPKTKVLPAAYLNVLDMLTHRDLVMTRAAVEKAQALWGGQRPDRHRGRPQPAAPVESAEAAKPPPRRPRRVQPVAAQKPPPPAKARRSRTKTEAGE